VLWLEVAGYALVDCRQYAYLCRLSTIYGPGRDPPRALSAHSSVAITSLPKVHLFEQHTVGFGASGRNGGMATTGMSIGIRDAVAKMGFDTAASLYGTYGRAVDLIEKLVTEEGIDCDFARPGKLILASKAAHFQGSEKNAELLNARLAVETHLVPKSELRREIESDAFRGGMVESRSASLHVGKYIRGLGEAAERAGVTIHEDAPVLKVTKLDSGHELETSRRRIQADQVLVATGAYTRERVRRPAAHATGGLSLEHVQNARPAGVSPVGSIRLCFRCRAAR
jgi:glycine/D-amino acid oxidase-like deaminating enzyme